MAQANPLGEHGAFLQQLKQQQGSAAVLQEMRSHIGECIDYMDEKIIYQGQNPVRVGYVEKKGDKIIGVLEGLNGANHIYQVSHKQETQLAFPMYITGGPYECMKPAQGGRRKQTNKKQKRKSRSNRRNRTRRSK